MAVNNHKKNKKNLDDDFDAIRRVLDGDQYAFGILQKKYTRIISSLIRRMVKNEDDIDDLTQETFIKAYNALSTFHFGYSFSSWLYRIASNNCIDFLRKKKFTTVSLNKTFQNSESDDEPWEIEDTSYLPDIDMLSEERKKAIFEAIESLPEEYNKIIKLRHEEELDYLQIANSLNLPLGTVKAHLFRARKMLLTQLKKKKNLFY